MDKQQVIQSRPANSAAPKIAMVFNDALLLQSIEFSVRKQFAGERHRPSEDIPQIRGERRAVALQNTLVGQRRRRDEAVMTLSQTRAQFQ
ncbi:hypothetical protein D3C76_946550 [compost metagenome]